jgi:hypothetical protein
VGLRGGGRFAAFALSLSRHTGSSLNDKARMSNDERMTKTFLWLFPEKTRRFGDCPGRFQAIPGPRVTKFSRQTAFAERRHTNEILTGTRWWASLCRAAQLAQFRDLTLALPCDLEVGFWDFGVTGTNAKYDRDWLGLRSETSLNRYRLSACVPVRRTE